VEDLHHASQAEDGRLGRNEGTMRLWRDDATLRQNSGLGCRYVDRRRSRCVDQLVEGNVEIRCALTELRDAVESKA